ncbi:MAG TPA: 5'/3'-nucleotidase SurE [bacterium]|nr:5'/3'-nucleotidase SurE [bacterium]HPQ65860.1 5'/3'-nucleotidase SurE [bacterium]
MKPLIMITNDDGINAPGLRVLAEEAAKIGDIVVIAPESERSAVGHGITLNRPLRAARVHRGERLFGYAVDGTPADCVKLAVKSLLARRPDLVVSGINPGPNAGINVIYSGTVSAAVEAAIMGLPALAVSLDSFTAAEFETAARVARCLAETILQKGLPAGVLLNCNVPALPLEQIKGIRITRQGTAGYREVIEKRVDPRGRDYFWLGGDLEFSKEGDGTDSRALARGWVSVTPLRYDLTDDDALKVLEGWGIANLLPEC